MKQQGFTLIELLIACIIITIITFSSHGSLNFLIEQSRISQDVSRLLMIVRSTRLHSITTSTTSVLCPSNDSFQCIRNWKLPLIVFNDINKNKKRDDNEPVIRQFEAFSAEDIRISYPKSQIRFNAAGIANFYNGTLSYCLKDSVNGIVISRLGRIRFAQDINGDNIPDVNASTTVSCR
jgi:type IV fimbrial biogenesis protein FimT